MSLFSIFLISNEIGEKIAELIIATPERRFYVNIISTLLTPDGDLSFSLFRIVVGSTDVQKVDEFEIRVYDNHFSYKPNLTMEPPKLIAKSLLLTNSLRP